MHDFQFYKPEEAIFGSTVKKYPNSEDQRTSKRIVISGFPYDQGTRRNGGRAGGAVATLIFRQTLSKMEIYPKKDFTVYDAGDIQADLQLEQAHRLLEEKQTKILSESNESLLVSVGGSNDQSYPNVSSLLANYPNQPIAVINLDAHFDVRPLKQDKAHSGSPFRQMLEDPRFVATGSRFIEFGAKGAACSQAHYDYLVSKQVPVYWLEKTIRRHKLIQQSPYITQAGQIFYDIIQDLQKTAQAIFVSFDVDVINSKWMPGVSAPSVIGGLTSDQAQQIASIAGSSSKVRLVDFSEFNPAVESVLSSHLLVELFYTLASAYANR